jgi:hypothetical protein
VYYYLSSGFKGTKVFGNSARGEGVEAKFGGYLSKKELNKPRGRNHIAPKVLTMG